ncbi:MAG: rhodanese-like domain-containing protein [Pseudomonadota bacterium]
MPAKTLPPSIFGRLFGAALILVATVTADAGETGIDTISAEAFQAERKDEVVLDVRTVTEYRSGHLEDAINININDRNFEQRIAALDPSKTYVVHCGANVPNGRADRALAKLRTAGFSNLRSLEGGYDGWVATGGAVSTAKE